MRQISVKQAQRWLDKLKNENNTSFKELGKILKKYERNDDEYECHIKINHLLLQTPTLAKEMNSYLDEANKFVINETEEEKITKLMGYVKQHRFEKFREILAMIQQMSVQNKGASITPEEQNKNLVACLKEIIKGDRQLEDVTRRALLSGEQLIAGQDLQHLKANHQAQNKNEEEMEEEGSRIVSVPQNTAAQVKKNQEKKVRQPQQYTPYDLGINREKRREAPKLPPMPMNPNEEKKILKILEKSFGTPIYDTIVKMMYLYQLCIITKGQIIEMLDFIESQQEFECLRDIIQSRQTDRRKNGAFRPLNDNDFSMIERASPSYVVIPTSYPIRCRNRTQELKKVLNDRWISVPYGSEQTFNVRNKNNFETFLLKSQDERYQFDLYTNKLRKAFDILEKAMTFLNQNDQTESEKSKQLVNRVIDMGVVQIVYRNANKEQKEQLEWHLKANQLETCTLFKERIKSQLHELGIIKQVHAIKNWMDVANKNFAKSLDLKSFQFKKGEKQRMKGTAFIQQLNERIKILENGGQQRLFSIPFEDKKSFFRICNSFQCSSKTQRCLNRKLPAVKQYEIKDFKNKSVLPVMIFSLEDQDTCAHIYSLILFYIESSVSNDSQKLRCKTFLELVLVNFFGWKHPSKRCISNIFDQQKFQAKIAAYGERTLNPMTDEQIEDIKKLDTTQWIYIGEEPKYLSSEYDSIEEFQRKKFRFNTMQNDKDYQSEYLPPREANSQILYASESFYIFLRFLYSLFERMIRMKQVAENKEKELLFDLLFFSCIKTKEGVRFEESLNSLFGKQAYLFSSIYKLFESLVKSISTASLCQMTNESFRYTKSIESQEMYLLLMNRFSLQNNLMNARMVRVNYLTDEKIIYINSLYSYYKGDEQIKDQVRKRQELAKNIQFYTLDTTGTGNTLKKKRKLNELYQQNRTQYLFDSISYKMTTYGEREDIFAYVGKGISNAKAVKRETKRIAKFNTKVC